MGGPSSLPRNQAAERHTPQPEEGSAWTKRDAGTGKFMDAKEGGKPFKGVSPDLRLRRLFGGSAPRRR